MFSKVQLTKVKIPAIMPLMISKIKEFFTRFLPRIKNNLNWFLPGLGVKRWMVVILGGTTLLGIGIGIFVLDVYRNAPETWWLPLLSYASLRTLPRLLRVLIFGTLGFGLLLGGIWGLNHVLVKPFIKPGQQIVKTLSTQRRKERGPHIVVIGGGHGISMVLRGLKKFTHHLTAVVTVADDGGSSGRLRASMGILPPGDLRNCLAALSDDETMITQLFQFRFANGGGDLDGHSFGNLFISALSEITGSFETAVAESSKVLAVNGQVLPSSLINVKLMGELKDPSTSKVMIVDGESNITESEGIIQRVWLTPSNPKAYPQVLQAILSADVIIIGPGSLYTSILPNLLVPDISAALIATNAYKIYVCNISTQPGETTGYSCGDHIQAVETHAGSGLLDVIVQNNNFDGKLLKDMQWVTCDHKETVNYPVYESDLIDETEPWHHDAVKLADVIMELYQAKTGPLAAVNQ